MARYRAAVIGLGRMGSTIDDERGPWAQAAFPYAHTPCYRSAGVEVVAGADPHGLGQAGLSHNGSHLLATTNYLSGSRVRWAFGHMASDQQAAGDEDLEGNGYLQYESGTQGYVRSMPVGGASWEFEVIGSQGRLRAVSDAQQIEFWKNVEPTLEGRRREPAKHIFPLPWFGESPNARTVRDLLVCIETGKQPNCSGDDGRHALEVAIAMRESHRRGGTRVELPLEDRSLRIISQETLGGDEPAAVRRAKAAAAR